MALPLHFHAGTLSAESRAQTTAEVAQAMAAATTENGSISSGDGTTEAAALMAFLALPPELVATIATFLVPADVASLASSFPCLGFLESEPLVWRPLYLDAFGELPADRLALARRTGRLCWAAEFRFRSYWARTVVCNVNKMSSVARSMAYLESLGLIKPFAEDRWRSGCAYLFGTPGVSPRLRGDFVCDWREPDLSPFHATVHLAGLSFVDALRVYLSRFRLPGESAKIDRAMYFFSEQFLAANPGAGLTTADQGYILAFALLMINTERHVATGFAHESTVERFITTMATSEVPEPLLREAYASICARALGVADGGADGADASKRHIESIATLRGAVAVDMSAVVTATDRQRSMLGSLFARVTRAAEQPVHAVLAHDALMLFNSADDMSAMVGEFFAQSLQVAVLPVPGMPAARYVELRAPGGVSLDGFWGAIKRTPRLARYASPVFRFRVETAAEAENWRRELNRTLNTRFVEVPVAESFVRSTSPLL